MTTAYRNRRRYGLLTRGVLAGGDAFSLLEIPDLQLWLDGSDLATLFQDSAATIPAASDGDVVGAWLDKSGNTRNCTQGTTSAKPTLRTNVKNGKPVVRFVTDDALDFAPPSPFTTGTFYCVSASTGSAGARFIAVTLSTLGDYNNSNAIAFGRANLVKVAADLLITVSQVTTWSIDRSNWSGGTAQYSRNAAVIGSDTYSTQTALSPQIGRIGTGRDVGANAFFLTGDIAELLFFTRQLTAEEMTLVEQYLNQKWAVY